MRIAPAMDYPNLLEIQTAPYESFMQVNVPADERKNEGLQAVFNNIFPIGGYLFFLKS